MSTAQPGWGWRRWWLMKVERTDPLVVRGSCCPLLGREGLFARTCGSHRRISTTTRARWVMLGKQEEIIINWCSGKCGRLRMHTCIHASRQDDEGRRSQPCLLKSVIKRSGWIVQYCDCSLSQSLWPCTAACHSVSAIFTRSSACDVEHGFGTLCVICLSSSAVLWVYVCCILDSVCFILS